jgi:HdeA/HdeB family
LERRVPEYDTAPVVWGAYDRRDGVNRGGPILVASCLALAAAEFEPERAPAQMTLTPRVIQIDQVKCAELESVSSDRKDRLLVYFNGYVDGMRRHTVWDERKVGELVERALNYCKADPTETVLSAFTRASR